MSISTVYSEPNNLNIIPSELSVRPTEKVVLMVDPAHYDILYVINPHMAGMIGTVNKEKAKVQWHNIIKAYHSIGYPVVTFPSVEGFPDMVFCANQSFPYLDKDGNPTVIISRMASEFRQGEEIHFERWYQSRDYKIIRQEDPPVEFEGMGDVLWHPNRNLLYAGYGFRTHKNALQRLAKCVNHPVVGLELIHPSFYHLDTALTPLDQETALYVKEAFTPEGEAMLQKCFPQLIKVPLHEAQKGFVTNGHCPDGKNFIVNKGNQVTNEALRKLGFNIIEVDTSEFIKSGGSVFCMKMMLPI